MPHSSRRLVAVWYGAQHRGVGDCPGESCFRRVHLFYYLRKRWVSHRLLGDPCGCPDSSPRAFAVVSIRSPQRLALTDGTFFLPDCYDIPWGRASALVGVAPEGLQERGCSYKVFSQRLLVCEVLVSAGIGSVSASLGGAMRTYRHPSALSARPGSVAVRRAPDPGPTQGDRGEISVLSVDPFVVLLQDRGVSVQDSHRVGRESRIHRVIQVDVRAPFDKGQLVFRRHVHESAYAGVLGRARSRSLGTEGAEALPRWDSSTSCPRWLLNTTCGAPSSLWARG
jgi:hypothetical protein